MTPTGLRVDVSQGEIIITSPGSEFCVVYYKPASQPQLVLKRCTPTDDLVLLAQAWRLANEKARELGWIV